MRILIKSQFSGIIEKDFTEFTFSEVHEEPLIRGLFVLQTHALLHSEEQVMDAVRG